MLRTAKMDQPSLRVAPTLERARRAPVPVASSPPRNGQAPSRTARPAPSPPTRRRRRPHCRPPAICSPARRPPQNRNTPPPPPHAPPPPPRRGGGAARFLARPPYVPLLGVQPADP